jgi:hypothetical protein
VLGDGHHAGKQVGGSREEQPEVGATLTESLDGSRRRQAVEAHASELLGHTQAQRSKLAQLAKSCAKGTPCSCVGGQLLAGKRQGALKELLLIV